MNERPANDPKSTPPPDSDLTLLGHSERRWPASPDEARLETFPNRSPQRDYWIDLDCPEFTSLCPVTGQPDFAALHIRYIPGDRCVETKSLKFYLASFRNQPSFNEEVVNRILDDLVAACDPRRMVVTGAFGSRGGISLTVTAEHPGLSE
ncbi:MAG: NADPH-dependent 7-cyano-7-deazaguanine reductase QueF [Verrucomicrobiae bacterium]|nr:NADPH-dependent 7-cyano-7-deazaguanine reductase QueF [Verrucomicrobiae bacterium]MCP5538679.1 NADPH-dependent 7-cyano-7-deazaguanine reductase QueF [Akkermansiaceae bacterium]MCP5550568.1 NADPH-dependent 7-cyano-7-deazaguanine reductase QueF [Akkermansiaceae bacterium]